MYVKTHTHTHIYIYIYIYNKVHKSIHVCIGGLLNPIEEGAIGINSSSKKINLRCPSRNFLEECCNGDTDESSRIPSETIVQHVFDHVPASTPSGLVLSLSLAELLTNCSACSAKLFCRSWLFLLLLCASSSARRVLEPLVHDYGDYSTAQGSTTCKRQSLCRHGFLLFQDLTQVFMVQDVKANG